jgi:hypothetical protein
MIAVALVIASRVTRAGRRRGHWNAISAPPRDVFRPAACEVFEGKSNMATTTVPGTPTFTAGGVASATFGSIGRNFVTFALLALLAEVPLQVLQWYTMKSRLGAAAIVGSPGAAITYGLTLIASSLLTIFMVYVLQAAIVYGTITDLNGRRASFGSCLSMALKVALPLIGLSIISGLGTALGFILLIVPGIIVALGWSVAVPVKVVERAGVFESLSRSWELTSGHKGTIFLLALVFAIASWIFAALGFAISGVFPFMHPGTAVEFPVVFYVYNGVIRAVTAMVGGAGAATIYYQLRAIKEGIAPEKLAAVFD